MSSLPVRMKKIQLKMKVLECLQDFSHYKSMGVFQTLKAANSAVLGPILSNFELGRNFMVVLLTCKNEEDLVKNRGARVFTTLYINFFRRARADNSGVGGGIWPKLELI